MKQNDFGSSGETKKHNESHGFQHKCVGRNLVRFVVNKSKEYVSYKYWEKKWWLMRAANGKRTQCTTLWGEVLAELKRWLQLTQ